MFRKSLISFSLFFLLFCLSFGRVTSVDYGVYEEKVRVVFRLSQQRDFKVFTLSDPRRIVVDIFGETSVEKLKLPSFIKAKIGRHRWGIRIVLLYPEFSSLKYFYLRNPHRIVLDIYKEKRDLYEELVALLKEEEKQEKDPIAELIKKVLSEPTIHEERVIVIDAGHGGKDPGAIGYGGIREKDVNLAIALLVTEYLKRDGRFKVILTRKGDYFVPLRKRAEIALRNRADLFISIHSDAAPRRNPRAKGTQVFALSYRRAIEKKYQILRSKRYAKLVLGEAADIRSSVVRRVLADMAIDVTLRESVYFARTLASELKTVLGRDVHFKGINRAGFAVLKTPGIPSVLVETGFITNPEEAAKLRNPVFRRKVAWAIYRAVVRYFYGDDFGRRLVKYK